MSRAACPAQRKTCLLYTSRCVYATGGIPLSGRSGKRRVKGHEEKHSEKPVSYTHLNNGKRGLTAAALNLFAQDITQTSPTGSPQREARPCSRRLEFLRAECRAGHFAVFRSLTGCVRFCACRFCRTAPIRRCSPHGRPNAPDIWRSSGSRWRLSLIHIFRRIFAAHRGA